MIFYQAATNIKSNMNANARQINYSSEFKLLNASQSIRIFINPERTWTQFLQRVIPIISTHFQMPPDAIEILIAGKENPVDATLESIGSQWNSYGDFLNAAFYIRDKNVPK